MQQDEGTVRKKIRNKSRLEVGSGEKNKQKASDINLVKAQSLKAFNTLFTPSLLPPEAFCFDLSICSQMAPQKAQVPAAAPLSLQMDLLTQPTDPVNPHPQSDFNHRGVNSLLSRRQTDGPQSW